MAQTDIRVIVPRVRRALEGAGAPATLTDDALKDVVADAIASVILYSNSAFGKQLVVTEEDEGIPSEYATSDALTLPEQTVIASQAALDYFFFQYGGVKISERIADEAQSWEYSLSANLLRDQLRHLTTARDSALETVAAEGDYALEQYVSFLAVRDLATAKAVEPWTDGLSGLGGYA